MNNKIRQILQNIASEDEQEATRTGLAHERAQGFLRRRKRDSTIQEIKAERGISHGKSVPEGNAAVRVTRSGETNE